MANLILSEAEKLFQIDKLTVGRRTAPAPAAISEFFPTVLLKREKDTILS